MCGRGMPNAKGNVVPATLTVQQYASTLLALVRDLCHHENPNATPPTARNKILRDAVENVPPSTFEASPDDTKTVLTKSCHLRDSVHVEGEDVRSSYPRMTYCVYCVHTGMVRIIHTPVLRICSMPPSSTFRTSFAHHFLHRSVPIIKSNRKDYTILVAATKC